MDGPRIPRLTTEDERNQIKARTQQLIRLAGGVEFFAPVTGVNKAALSKYGSPSEPDSFIRADVIVELDRQIGAPMMVGMLAALLGYKLVPAEQDAPAGVGIGDIAETARETGEVVTQLATALADGALDPAERRGLRKEIAEATATLTRLDRKLAGGGQ